MSTNLTLTAAHGGKRHLGIDGHVQCSGIRHGQSIDLGTPDGPEAYLAAIRATGVPASQLCAKCFSSTVRRALDNTEDVSR